MASKLTNAVKNFEPVRRNSFWAASALGLAYLGWSFYDLGPSHYIYFSFATSFWVPFTIFSTVKWKRVWAHTVLQTLMTLGFFFFWDLQRDAPQAISLEYTLSAFGAAVIVLHIHWVTWALVSLINWKIDWNDDNWTTEFVIVAWVLLFPIAFPLTCIT
jgi:hypothetical protein